MIDSSKVLLSFYKTLQAVCFNRDTTYHMSYGMSKDKSSFTYLQKLGTSTQLLRHYCYCHFQGLTVVPSYCCRAHLQCKIFVDQKQHFYLFCLSNATVKNRVYQKQHFKFFCLSNATVKNRVYQKQHFDFFSVYQMQQLQARHVYQLQYFPIFQVYQMQQSV